MELNGKQKAVGWDLVKLASCCSKITDGTHDTPRVVNSGRPFFTAIHVKENGIDYDNCLYLSEDDHRTIYQRCNPVRDDILMVNIGAGVCTTAIVEVDYEFSIKNVALLKPDRSLVCSKFLDQVIKFNRETIVKSLTNGGAQPFLGLGQIGELSFVLPLNKKEQEAIANALSDADAYIESLEKLITKKRLIKKGVMQELLTGRRRLEGYTDNWVVKSLGSVAELYQPQTISANMFTESGFPVYGANGIVGFYNQANHTSWQVTVTCRGSTCGTVNKTVEKCWITGNAMVVNSNSDIDRQFLFYKLSSISLQDCITGTGQPQIVRGPLAAVNLEIPTDKNEQIQIGNILADADNEIFILETKLNKARLIKQGMMQELLTGRIRLV
ncbi:MAG: restriction endonuclease subunit S [Bacteriovoracaceae bacterium]